MILREQMEPVRYHCLICALFITPKTKRKYEGRKRGIDEGGVKGRTRRRAGERLRKTTGKNEIACWFQRQWA